MRFGKLLYITGNKQWRLLNNINYHKDTLCISYCSNSQPIVKFDYIDQLILVNCCNKFVVNNIKKLYMPNLQKIYIIGNIDKSTINILDTKVYLEPNIYKNRFIKSSNVFNTSPDEHDKLVSIISKTIIK